MGVGVIDTAIERVWGAAGGSSVSAPALVAAVIVELLTLSFAALTGAMLYYDLKARIG